MIDTQHDVCVMSDANISALQAVSSHTIIVGPASSGKLCAAKAAFPLHHEVKAQRLNRDCVTVMAQNAAFTRRSTVIVKNITNKHSKLLANLIDRFSEVLVFVATARQHSDVSDLLKSRCYIHRIKPPLHNERVRFLLNAGLDCKTAHEISDMYVWPHDVMLGAALARAGVDPQIDHWKHIVHELCAKLFTASHVELRTLLLRLLMVPLHPTIIFKSILFTLLDQHPSAANIACNLAATYEHLHVCGNKPLYQLEAFVFGTKQLAYTNGGADTDTS